MNSIHQQFIFKYMFVILYKFTKFTTIFFALCDFGHIYTYIYYVIKLYNINDSSSLVLLLLVIIMFCNIHVYPLFFSSISFKFCINMIFNIFFNSYITFTILWWYFYYKFIIVYQKGKFVCVVPLSFIYWLTMFNLVLIF